MILYKQIFPMGRIIFLLLTFGLFSTNGQAAIMLAGGLTHQYNVSGGQYVSGVFELRNAGNTVENLTLYQEDSSPVSGNQAHDRSNKAWVLLSTDRLTLAPGASRQVSYTLQIPANTEVGTYWSLVMLEPVSAQLRELQAKKPEENNEGFTVGVQQKVRYAVNIMTHIDGGNAHLTFSTPHIETGLKKQKVFTIDIQNTGSKYTRPDISMEVFNSEGQVVKTLSGKSRGVYPGAKKRFVIPLADLTAGNYKALFIAEDKDSGKTFGSDINLTVKS